MVFYVTESCSISATLMEPVHPVSQTYFSTYTIHSADYMFLLVLVGRVSAPRSGGTGFDPGPRHTKVVNNGTSCSPIGTRLFGVGLGLVAPVSV